MDRIFRHLEKHSLIYVISFSVIWIFFHFPYWNMDFGGDHMWRQGITVWNIINFVEVDANILNPRTSYFNQLGPDDFHRYEFPLVQWCIAMLIKITGNYILTTRIFLSVIGILGAIGIYQLINFIYDDKNTALVTFVAFLFSPLIFYYSLVPIPDTAALTCSIWYLYYILKYRKKQKLYYLFSASILLSLAVLIKLPFIIFTIVSIIHFFMDIRKRRLGPKTIYYYTFQILALVPPLLWYKWVMPFWYGNPVKLGIFDASLAWNEIERILNHTWKNYLLKDLLYFPVIPLILAGIYYYKKIKPKSYIINGLFFICLLYFLFEFNAIQISHNYYMMPFLVPLYYLIANGVFYIKKMNIGKIIISLSLLVIPFSAIFLNQDKWDSKLWWLKEDLLNNKEVLRNAVPDTSRCVILNDISKVVFPYYIRKKGFVYSGNDLPVPYLRDNIQREKAEYLYSDSRAIDTNSLYTPYLERIVLKAGEIHVYKLVDPFVIDSIPE